jgi:Na+/proline symporter
MILVASATSYFVIVLPNVRIIPIVLGIYGYTYGSVLGIFLAGMLTKSRGSNYGNVVAMIVGFIVVTVISDLPNTVARAVLKISDPHEHPLYQPPSWLPTMEFPWWICFGTIVTFFVALLFKTSHAQLAINKFGGEASARHAG